jgi:NADH-quinone oxidoreductase subunit M
VLGAVGIIWGGLACLVERDLKRLVAYSSVAHMGFVAIGLASGTRTGLQAALFANVAHGVISALLFVVVGGLKERWGSADLATARAAVREVAPRLGFALIVGLAASLGLPGLAGFWGEFLSVYAAWSPAADRPGAVFRTVAVVAALGTVLAAAYSLRVARTVWAGDRTEPFIDDSSNSEWDVVAVLVVAALVLGIAPGPLLAITSDAVSTIVRAAP